MFRWGDAHPLRRVAAALIAAALLAVLAGCGGGDGIGDDAVLSVYVEAPLCAEASKELVRHGGKAGDVELRVTCLPRAEKDNVFDLSQIGENARRATEDSSSIAYIAEPARGVDSFSLPILEEADIPQLTSSSGSNAISRLVRAVEEADEAGSLREAVSEELR